MSYKSMRLNEMLRFRLVLFSNIFYFSYFWTSVNWLGVKTKISCIKIPVYEFFPWDRTNLKRLFLFSDEDDHHRVFLQFLFRISFLRAKLAAVKYKKKVVWEGPREEFTGWNVNIFVLRYLLYLLFEMQWNRDLLRRWLHMRLFGKYRPNKLVS